MQFLSVARGSASEVSAQLYVALDQGYVTKDCFKRLQEQAARTGSVLSGLIRYLKSTAMRGSKYRADSE